MPIASRWARLVVASALVPWLAMGAFAQARAGAQESAEATFKRILSGDRQAASMPAAPAARAPVAGDEATRARLARARAAEVEGRLADARREYTAALPGIVAGRHLVHVGIGRLAQVEGDLDAAIGAFAQAARLSPNDPFVHRELAAAYAAVDRFDDAFAALVAALVIVPGDADVFAAIGQLFLDADRAADAIPALRRALALKADRYQTHYALAVALSRTGRTDEAEREFDRFERASRQALENRRRQVSGEAPQ